MSVATAEAGCVETPRFSAAAVLERIASLKKDYEEQMVAASASDKKRIAAEAFSAFQKAVTDQGLSVISILRRTIQKLATRYASVFRLRPTSCLAEMRQAVVPGENAHTSPLRR